MLRRIVLFGLLAGPLLGAAATWALVSTDRWPLDDRREPALTVWKLNRAVGHWLADHGEAPPSTVLPQATPESLTAEELAEIEKLMREDPRLRDRVRFDFAAIKKIQPGPLGPSLNLSTGAATMGGGGGGGGGGRRRG